MSNNDSIYIVVDIKDQTAITYREHFFNRLRDKEVKILNASTNLPGGMTRADYNRLFTSKVEFIRVDELPTSDIKAYPTIYILMKDTDLGIMCEYDAENGVWMKYGGDLGIVQVHFRESDRTEHGIILDSVAIAEY